MAGLASEMLAGMRAHEEVFRYWKAQRRAGRLPARRDIDPLAMKKNLPLISLIDVTNPHPVNDPNAFRQRLAGTELYTAYGEEITGKTIRDIYTPDQALYWAQELSFVVETKKPNVGMHSLAWRGSKEMALFWIRLPLATDGVHVDMILGHDIIIGKTAVESGIKAA